MVEPLRPELREELKRAHEGLGDDEIDRLEELIALRFTLDPRVDQEQLRAIDEERRQLVRERMPRFDEIYQRFRASEPETRPDQRRIEIEIQERRPDEQQTQ